MKNFDLKYWKKSQVLMLLWSVQSWAAPPAEVPPEEIPETPTKPSETPAQAPAQAPETPVAPSENTPKTEEKTPETKVEPTTTSPTDVPSASTNPQSGGFEELPEGAPETSSAETTVSGDQNTAEDSKKDEVPPEIKSLESSLDSGPPSGLDPHLYEPDEPGGALKPSDRFFRVPLKPQMSDSNWRRWIGPVLSKDYKLRKTDTLWGISERLFGNPYLWPKVWQLNAYLGNPHVVNPGQVLAFTPGNPQSAPVLAFQTFPGMSSEELPIMRTGKSLTFLERLERILKSQSDSADPPFQYFLMEEVPESVGTVPKPKQSEKMFFETGDSWPADGVGDGTYAVVRQIQGDKHDLVRAQRVRWIGDVQVRSGQAKLIRAFAEVGEKDLIVKRSFEISPLALHEFRLGREDREAARLVPLQEGYEVVAGSGMFVGIRFPTVENGARTGALLKIMDGSEVMATLLVVYRDRRMATAWVVESRRELDLEKDHID
jgi:nucleoid-associated protein YgaU